VNFIGEFEAAIVRYAQRHAVDAVLCGHIHSAGIRQVGAVTYYNCGDWVETCAALVENFDGEIELLNFNPHQTPVAATVKKQELAGSLL
jgi:UDP-2,3-diacylglucosamine pyrophosphatase LpxH